MPGKKIFLSYRRDDVPGYVGRLADDLEAVFGAEQVFRDVDDIRGGADWRASIDAALQQSAVLLLLIGPRWSDIWRARAHAPIDYMALELERARALHIPVHPVTVGGGTIANELDLTPIDWIRARQIYDISDIQGRWDKDVAGLIAILQPLIATPHTTANTTATAEHASLPTRRLRTAYRRLLLLLAGLSALLISGIVMYQHYLQADKQATPLAVPPRPAAEVTASTAPQASLEGRWVSEKTGKVFQFRSLDNQRFAVIAEALGRGQGQWLEKMPNKLRFKIDAAGQGEFSLSNSHTILQGWFKPKNSTKIRYDRLMKQPE